MVEKYYVWKNGDHADDDGFFDYADAYAHCVEVDGDEIELTKWENAEAYENGCPATAFKTVWRR